MNLRERVALNDLPEGMQDLFAASLDYAALAQMIVTTSF